MSNLCSFSVTVRGPLADRRGFASAFRSTITGKYGDSNGGKLHALLNEGAWGQTDEDDHKWLEIWPIYLWWPKPGEGGHYPPVLGETVLELEDRSEFRGSCKWGPPVAWLEKVANLMPSLSFICRSATEHDLYEEYGVSSAEVRRLKLAVFDRKTDGWISQDPDEDV